MWPLSCLLTLHMLSFSDSRERCYINYCDNLKSRGTSEFWYFDVPKCPDEHHPIVITRPDKVSQVYTQFVKKKVHICQWNHGLISREAMMIGNQEVAHTMLDIFHFGEGKHPAYRFSKKTMELEFQLISYFLHLKLYNITWKNKMPETTI